MGWRFISPTYSIPQSGVCVSGGPTEVYITKLQHPLERDLCPGVVPPRWLSQGLSPVPVGVAVSLEVLFVYILCYFSLSVLVPSPVPAGSHRDALTWAVFGCWCHTGAQRDRAGSATGMGAGLGLVLFWGGGGRAVGRSLSAGLCHEQGSPSSSLCLGENWAPSSPQKPQAALLPLLNVPGDGDQGPALCLGAGQLLPPSPPPAFGTHARVPL